MLRRNFIHSALALYPITVIGKPMEMSTFLTRTQRGFKVNANEARFGERSKMKGVTLNILDLKISSKDTDGAFAIFEQTGLTPYGGPPLHIHPNQDEVFYVVEGNYHFQVGEDKFEMKSGDTIFLPRNVQHAFIQLTEKAKMIVTYVPAGQMEAFFKYTDAWTTPPDKDEIAKAFKDHEMLVVGPPLSLDK